MTSPWRRRLVFGLAAAAALAVGCQLIVPSDVPEFACATADPSACPSGMVCDVTLGRCTTSTAVTPEAGDEDVAAVDGGDGPILDDSPAGPAELGEDCALDGDCKSKLCGTSTILTTGIVQAGTKSICTKTCCTSADCPSGSVCFGTATGGNYCVPAKRAQRTPAASGGKTPGQTCADHDECRSGLCDTGRCLDTCCLASDCATGTTCRVRLLSAPPPQQLVWTCAAANPSPAKDLGAACTETSDCKNDNCVFGNFPDKRCTPSCCSNTQCAAQGATFSDNVCAYGNNGGADQLKWCFVPNKTGFALGVACNSNTECQSRYCDADQKKCAAPCCKDTDCPAEGFTCRPSPVGTPFLRCVQAR